jgi:hypothetical protein
MRFIAIIKGSNKVGGVDDFVEINSKTSLAAREVYENTQTEMIMERN